MQRDCGVRVVSTSRELCSVGSIKEYRTVECGQYQGVQNCAVRAVSRSTEPATALLVADAGVR